MRLSIEPNDGYFLITPALFIETFRHKRSIVLGWLAWCVTLQWHR